jgi:hypothetical protein
MVKKSESQTLNQMLMLTNVTMAKWQLGYQICRSCGDVAMWRRGIMSRSRA